VQAGVRSIELGRKCQWDAALGTLACVPIMMEPEPESDNLKRPAAGSFTALAACPGRFRLRGGGPTARRMQEGRALKLTCAGAAAGARAV
jgi:hypothetical protein